VHICSWTCVRMCEGKKEGIGWKNENSTCPRHSAPNSQKFQALCNWPGVSRDHETWPTPQFNYLPPLPHQGCTAGFAKPRVPCPWAMAGITLASSRIPLLMVQARPTLGLALLPTPQALCCQLCSSELNVSEPSSEATAKGPSVQQPPKAAPT
jgi:hypothetical protein